MSHIISKDGTRISFIKEGRGTPLILVGGALQTKKDRLFAELFSLCSKNFTVVSYDRRGRGESGDTQLYSVDREIEDLNALIEELGGDVFLFGNSSGAHLALKTALVNPKVSKMAVYEAPFISDKQLGSAAEYEKILRDSIAQGQPDKTLKAFFLRIGVPRFAIFMMRLMPMWKGLKKLANTLLYDALLVSDGSVPQEFQSISAKTLVLSGSTPRMVEAAKGLSNVISQSQLKILQGQTHAVNPAVLSEELRGFFEG